ncbi:dynein regulatory complex protein 1 isoform X2 [Xyrichtys novacula]|uniref:Dynein regulatory complex protein 1 n=1 Tax=Xyrichtys novacula TaxID=13765 RepID=A0AAV1GWE8_XYRNO|nr:dynein regulatory complex protein 1 isoform X2 [Xyrichtys novacula]
MVLSQRILTLQRELPEQIRNIQTAADAKESMRRTEQEKACRLRLELLENDVKSSQEKFGEIIGEWSTANQKITPQELQELLNNQQKLSSALLDDKKRVINELQQELKVGDDRYVKDLRKHAEELGLMMERVEDQIKTLKMAYREELAHIQRINQQESEVLLTTDKAEWEQRLKALWDKELDRLMQRQEKVEEYNEKVEDVVLETRDQFNDKQLGHNEKLMAMVRERKQLEAASMSTQRILTVIPKPDGPDNLIQRKLRLVRKEMLNLKAQYSSQQKCITQMKRQLTDRRNRIVQQHGHTQKKIQHFAVADVKKFEQMWLMIEDEVKQLVERVLVLDSIIYKQHLGLAWERPHMAFMGRSGLIQPQKQTQSPTHQAVTQVIRTQDLQGSQRMTDASVGPMLKTDAESVTTEVHKAESEGGAEVEERKLSNEALKTVMELLCDELGFLFEEKFLSQLAPLEEEEQAVMKLSSLFSAFGISKREVPRLAQVLLKHKNQKRLQTEDVCVETGNSSDKAEDAGASCMSHVTSEHMDLNHLLPALKSFLEQHMRSREVPASQNLSFQCEAVRDTSEDQAYWESMSNVISEDKVKVWEAAESKIKQYHAELTEISELITETLSLEQQNAELRVLLQQYLQSIVSVCVCVCVNLSVDKVSDSCHAVLLVIISERK